MRNTMETEEGDMNTAKSTIGPIMAGVAVAMLIVAGATSKADASSDVLSLDSKQRGIIPIAAFTASGEVNKLKPALVEGLDAGLTVNEIKEILVQMYAYAGFPRSLNGLNAFMEVLDGRKAKGIEDTVGRDASPVPADLDRDRYGARVQASLAGHSKILPLGKWQQFSPIIDTFLKEHLFADIFVRDVLDMQGRELATIAALANMSGTSGQLRFHFGAAMNTGLSARQMTDFVAVLRSEVGKRVADDAATLLAEVLKARGN